MHINWDVTTRFDPNSVLPSTHGIPIPSYGNYGGPNYSAGVEGGTPSNPANPLPVDDLDTLFWQHDLVLQNSAATPLDIFQADLNLVLGIHNLPQTAPTLFNDPEARLYAGLAELTIAEKILTTESSLADASVKLFLAGVALPEAISNFEEGLAETPGNEARSLNGAFHVFEAHAEQAMASLGSPSAVESSSVSPHGAPDTNELGTAMAQHTTLPDQATSHAADAAQSHLPTELPPVQAPPTSLPNQATSHAADAAQDHLPTFPPISLTALSTSLPDQATSHAADPAQDHLPTELPPVPPTTVTLPDAADHMSLTGLSHLPDWIIT
jgi:hypothetical protein